jgi:pilus assembly protein CpaF
MTTVHANTPRDALGRLEQMMTMLGTDLPIRTMRAQMTSALHVVVQLNRFSDGRRRVTSIAEITGMEGEVITMQEIFAFRRRGKSASGEILGDFVTTGIRPKCAEALITAGVNLDEASFQLDEVRT